MKKVLSFALILTLVFCTLSLSFTAHADNDDKVEISFCVGDDALLINGNTVTVEKPYVVGEGVTLVPVRVITEAFGAKVDWEGTTQTVTITYPDIDIVLQIGNPVAEVNKRAETLLAPPEISGSTTMVPLRFISENLGAQVSYDVKTTRITVMKDISAQNSTIEGSVENKNVGDSFYGWTMERPEGMTMSERTFDGLYTCFEADENNQIAIAIYPIDDEYEFERDFIDAKNSFQGLTTVTATKNVDDKGVKSMHFQVKDKTEFFDMWKYITDKYIYTVVGYFENNTDVKYKDFIRVMSTFDCAYNPVDTHDLSNVKNSIRRFEMQELGFAIDIPDWFYMTSSEEAINEANFMALDENDTNSEINIGIYSKSSVGSAKELAEKDYTLNKDSLNPDLAKFSSAVTENTYKTFSSFEYTLEVHSSSIDSIGKDVFFELGEYVYNVHVDIKLPNSSANTMIDKILNSISLTKPDEAKVGVLMRNINDDEGTYTVEVNGWILEVPANYVTLDRDSSTIVLTGNALLSFSVSDASGINNVAINSRIKELANQARKQKGVTVIKTQNVNSDNIKYAQILTSQEDEDGKVYVHQYVAIKDKSLLVFTASYSDLGYSQNNISEVEGIIRSAKKK